MPGCDKQFVRRFNLKVHIITHDPERAHQFECIEGCGRRYTRKNDMERHVKSVHLGERLKCQTCGFRFTRVDGLRKHNCNSPMSSPYVADSGHTPRPLALKPSSSSSSSVSSISVSTTTSSSSSSSVVMAAQALASRLSLSNTRGTAEARSSAAPHQDSPAARPPNNVDPKLEEPAKATDSGRPRFLLPAPSGSATTAGSQSSFNAVSTANAGGGSHPGEEPIHENSFAVRRSEPAEIKQTLCAKEETPTDEKPVWRLVRDTSNL
ncbi:hypothetical protein BGZ73_006935 [Actinomortierella ambigua]|nr:hypothetical protein BGZ73_006935 [Actinomortierella ambigua]